MKIAIIYSSKTGNTKAVAKAIKETLKNQNLIYFNMPSKKIPIADIYIIGSWTFKGSPTDDIIQILKALKNKKIAYFGTAGYGGNPAYYQKLFERVKSYIDSSNEILGYFYCQGKMPNQITGDIKSKRSKKLIELSDINEKNYNDKLIDENVEVLFEEPKGGYIKGHTQNFILVKCKTDENFENQIKKVKIIGAETEAVIGEIYN